jgi:sortase B
MWIALAVFVGSVGYLGVIAYSYWSDSHRYDEISDKVFTPEVDALADMAVDWDALRAINPDVVAWVYVPDSPISYPVCWAKGDNQKYLDVNFDGAAGVFTGAGTIFLDGEAKPDFSDPADFLFGHHMNDGSMFACLSSFAAEGEFEAHRDVYLLTPERNYKFRSFALVRTNGTDFLVVHEFADETDRVKYIADKEERSLVAPKEGFPEPATAGKLLALSTCDYNESDGRAILYSCLVDYAMPSAAASNVVGDAEGYATPGE